MPEAPAMIRKPCVLLVDKSSTDCTNCMANILGWETITRCPECKHGFTHIATPYADQDLGDSIFARRPDLPRMEYREAYALMME